MLDVARLRSSLTVRCQCRMVAHRAIRALASGLVVICIGLTACQSPPRASQASSSPAPGDDRLHLFRDAELPRKLGSVENIGLQPPLVSPDGSQLLYLQTDRDELSPVTLLGLPDPPHTPSEGTLSVWIRPVEGTAVGRRLSPQRWAHSPVWSDSGHAIAYVVNEPPQSYIVRVDLGTGQADLLGVRNALNCLPRFDLDDQTLLFCAARTAGGAHRVYRQRIGESDPTPLTPDGLDWLFPVCTGGAGSLPVAGGDRVLCARAEGAHLTWVQCTPAGSITVATPWGNSARPAMLQTWAGIVAPLSPQRDAVLFYDGVRDRICVLHVTERTVRRHRPGSIAACWLDNQSIALATPDGVFVVDTVAGTSVSLFNGAWIPSRYVPATRRLILLGRETPRRFAIWEVVLKPGVRGEPGEGSE